MGTTPDILVSIIKLPLEEAIVKIKEAGFRVRITSENGEGYLATMDYRTDRVNLAIVNGFVTFAHIG